MILFALLEDFMVFLWGGYEGNSKSDRCTKPSHCPSFLVFLEFHQVTFILDVTEQFWFIFFLSNFIYLFIHSFMAALGICCCTRAFSLVALSRGYSLLWCGGFSCCGAWALGPWAQHLWLVGSRAQAQ